MSGDHFKPEDSSAKRGLGRDSDDGIGSDSAKRQRTCREDYTGGQRNEKKAPSIRFLPTEYTVGWVCALWIEMAAGLAMLDRIHGSLPTIANDSNEYILGNVGAHNVVMACLGSYGTNNAATVASNMLRSFPSIHVRLMVGIGGGVPGDVDIRLGDIVVGERVIQHDLGKIVPGDRVQRTGISKVPPLALQNAISKLRALHETTVSGVPSLLQDMHDRHPKMAAYAYPRLCEDRLFRATYDHDQSADCSHCCPSQLQYRPLRANLDPEIHYGGIASGNQVVKCGRTRDTLAKELNVVCFEMEAAGLMDSFPCIVIRGICDYADSHKNKQWQRYAAAGAAAYAKELLSTITPSGSNDTPVTYSPGPCPEDVQEKLQAHRKDLLESLRFEQIDSRYATIKTAHTKTCEWLLDDPLYKTWLDPSKAVQHHGFLWISGKPGAGKSTIMKFTLNCARKGLRADAANVSFFFNARGDNLEKSTIGLHRSLLLQLLERFPDLQTVLDDPTLIPLQQTSCPTIEILRDLFRNAVLALGHRRLTCFVDALDECDEQQVREMVAYFEDLGEQATADNIKLKVCFSSRHYPQINVRKGIQLILENQNGHEQDLEKYVRSRLTRGPSSYIDKIRTQILEKADGVFMWVVLVIDVLNKEIDRGRLFTVEKRLREIPSQLSELFKDILRRDNDNMEDLLLCIQWILFAKRPLNRKEYYFAILSGLPECDEDFITYDPERNTDEGMEDFVISSSKGLAEITKAKSGTVQFIHESVRDFLIKDNGLKELWPGLGDDFQSLSHERLKQCCHSYISRDHSGQMHISDVEALPKANTEQGKEHRQEALEQLPFLEYATENVLHHANIAAGGVSQEEFLDQFQLKGWIHLNNILEKHQIRRYTPTATLTYILAEKNFVSLLNLHLRHHSNVHIRGERYGFPFFAALVNGHWVAAMACLGQAASHLSHEEIFPAVDYRKEFDAGKGLRSSPLHWALENKHAALARLLIASNNMDYTMKDAKSRTTIHSAAIGDDQASMVMVVENMVNSCNTETDDATSPSQSTQTTAMGAVDHFARRRTACINMEDKDGITPLSFAAQNGHQAVARILLDWGAALKPLRKGYEWRKTPLAHAAENGHEAIARMLIEKGAVVDSTDVLKRTPLHGAIRMNHEATAKILIENGADVFHTSFGPSPLLVAAEYGSDNIIKLLLENGVSTDCLTPDKRTPLHLAASRGHEGVVKCLLSKGVFVEPADGLKGSTPLHEAARKGFEDVVRILLEYGSSVDFRDETGQTALHEAAANGREAVARMLLENGASVTPVTFNNQTPRELAAVSGHEAVVKMLVDLEYCVPGKLCLNSQLLVERAASTDLADVHEKAPIITNGHEPAAMALSENVTDQVKPQNDLPELFLADTDFYGYGEQSHVLLRKGENTEVTGEDDVMSQMFVFDDAEDDPWLQFLVEASHGAT